MIVSILIVLFVIGFFLSVFLKFRDSRFDLFAPRKKTWQEKAIEAAEAKRKRKAERKARENNPILYVPK